MMMLPVLSHRGVELHCEELRREGAHARLTASLQIAPSMSWEARARHFRERISWRLPWKRPRGLEATQLVRGFVARP